MKTQKIKDITYFCRRLSWFITVVLMFNEGHGSVDSKTQVILLWCGNYIAVSLNEHQRNPFLNLAKGGPMAKPIVNLAMAYSS